ncbi:oxygen-independent coproporphyrinogen III oxidase [Enterococcus sp. MMGLQ5-2]|nr:oxygen-independent coproporphyrinogen III oxidase [Enterococcus sp. MMGLQ5-2]MBS7585287.1 oxygen-independent coproporphyrinogen III oxidase [Enterococcus sp. MMGLQ5-1]NPD13144.1 oxygen-independent coproporphyrinogen III oxidase [Enterococcus sp. MMGLQ5-1]NPD37854.1 oxygen-independent coproporphyrinogen III oxidase [Enterococcus sp. MMGLQ5-2]
MVQKPSSTYIHIPFCSQICFYCDFSKVLIDYQPVDAYITAILKEIEQAKPEAQRTIYIGGGTPTAISPQQLRRLLEGIEARIDMSSVIEYTIEANPNDLTEEIVAVIADSKINRVSIGVQTFNSRLLKKIGRNHTPQDISTGIQRLREAEIHNLSIDLIYALPGQTIDDLRQTLASALALELPHYSIYSLILENQTVFMNQLRRGKLNLPDNEVEYEMYQIIRKALRNQGFKHYEVSNFGQRGYESQHNLVYWNNQSYYGFGAGASGYVDGIRYKNHGPIQHYLKGIAQKQPRVSEEKLTIREIIEEELFLGLRKAEGISIEQFNAQFPFDFQQLYGVTVENLLEKDLVKIEEQRLKMTALGLNQGNDVFEAFLIEGELPKID